MDNHYNLEDLIAGFITEGEEHLSLGQFEMSRDLCVEFLYT